MSLPVNIKLSGKKDHVIEGKEQDQYNAVMEVALQAKLPKPIVGEETTYHEDQQLPSVSGIEKGEVVAAEAVEEEEISDWKSAEQLRKIREKRRELKGEAGMWGTPAMDLLVKEQQRISDKMEEEFSYMKTLLLGLERYIVQEDPLSEHIQTSRTRTDVMTEGTNTFIQDSVQSAPREITETPTTLASVPPEAQGGNRAYKEQQDNQFDYIRREARRKPYSNFAHFDGKTEASSSSSAAEIIQFKW